MNDLAVARIKIKVAIDLLNQASDDLYNAEDERRFVLASRISELQEFADELRSDAHENR